MNQTTSDPFSTTRPSSSNWHYSQCDPICNEPLHEPNQPLVNQLTLASGKPPFMHQPTMKPPLMIQPMSTTMNTDLETTTKTKAKRTNRPPLVSLTPEPTNPTNTTPITMAQCREFIANKMAVF